MRHSQSYIIPEYCLRVGLRALRLCPEKRNDNCGMKNGLEIKMELTCFDGNTAR